MFPTLAQSLNMNSLHLYSAGQVQLEANHKLVHYYCKSTVEPWWCWAVLPLPLRGCFLLFLLTGPLTFPDSPESLVCPVHDQQLKSSPEYQEVNRHEGSYISIPVIFSITAHLLFLPSPPKRSIFPWFQGDFYIRLLILSFCFLSSLYVIDWSLSTFSPLCLLCKSVFWRLKTFEPLILKQRSLSHGSVYLSSYSQLLALVCSNSLSFCPTLTFPSTCIRFLLPPSLYPNIY